MIISPRNQRPANYHVTRWRWSDLWNRSDSLTFPDIRGSA